MTSDHWGGWWVAEGTQPGNNREAKQTLQVARECIQVRFEGTRRKGKGKKKRQQHDERDDE